MSTAWPNRTPRTARHLAGRGHEPLGVSRATAGVTTTPRPDRSDASGTLEAGPQRAAPSEPLSASPVSMEG